MKKILIKICGMTNVDDVMCANDISEIDYIGIIFTEKSPRYVTFDIAEKLINACHSSKKVVGVFMNQNKKYISTAVNNLNLDILQFHGHESLDFCNQFQMPFVKTVHIKNNLLDINREFINYAYAFLFDTSTDNLDGGTGKIFNWKILNNNKLLDESALSSPYFVAGGLNCLNIQDLILKYNPPGIDVSSGLESDIGKKDHLLMKKFIENVRISQLEYYEKN